MAYTSSLLLLNLSDSLLSYILIAVVRDCRAPVSDVLTCPTVPS